MYKMIAQNGKTKYGVAEFVVDTVEDLENLPDCEMGSSCLVLTSPVEVFVKGGDGQWKPL